MGLLKEFREFAVKGNVIDLAVGVIIGAAFGKIVDSLIKDLIMPIVALLVGAPDFSNAYIAFKPIPKGLTLVKAQELSPVFAYGNFLTVVVNFLLLALAVFVMVKFINKMKRNEPAPVAKVEAVSSTDKLLIEIRDNLQKRP
ncbi:MAG: large conductance mechanosensitive channel protein MscL [Flavitalea sp.]